MAETRTGTPITVSTVTILKIAAVLLGFWALYAISDILVLLIASLLLASALDPWVDALQQRYHIPRQVSMLGIYAVLLAVLASAILLLAPPVIDEVQQIAQDFPAYYTRANAWIADLTHQNGSSLTPLQDLSRAITAATPGVFSFISDIFGGIASFVIVLFITYYMVVDEGAIKRTATIAPKRHQAYLTALINRLQRQTGVWLRAQLILMGIIAVMTYCFLLIIGMPYALVLALFAGLMEFVPYLGPLLSAVPAVFLAYAISPQMAIVVAGTYYVIQLLENNIIVPKIMEKALGLSPIVSIVVFLVGARFAGIAGALFAIPIATVGMVLMQDLLSARAARAE